MAISIGIWGGSTYCCYSQKKGYQIVAGERRWRAATMLGLENIPAIIKEYTEQELMEIALIENLQREDLNPIEEANAYKELMDKFDLTRNKWQRG